MKIQYALPVIVLLFHFNSCNLKESKEPKLITPIIGNYSQPINHPNTGHIIFTNLEGNNIYLKKKDARDEILILEKNGVRGNFGWARDGKSVLYKEKAIVKSLPIDNAKIGHTVDIHNRSQLNTLVLSDTTYYLDLKSRRMMGSYNKNSWVLSKEAGNFYNFLPSPKEQLFIAHKGSQIGLYKTNGQFIKDLGVGIATDWSSDGSKIVGFLDETADGHQISNSDLFIINIKKNTRKRITTTKDIWEMWPTFVSDHFLVYSDEKNGGIFDLKIQ